LRAHWSADVSQGRPPPEGVHVAYPLAAINDETSDLLSARERVALRFAEKLAVDHQKVDEALCAELRAGFSEAEVIELVAHTTLYIGFGRFNEIVGLDPS
jgi:alkylhydroperoxidase family enzyme